jgi:hypothetical protein
MSFKVQRAADSSHWYHRDGRPCHEVPYADPRKGMRPTTVTDARKLGLIPSVTNILGVKSKPQLETWKMDQTIRAALTLERIENETPEAFAARIAIAADAERDQASAWGTELHDQIETFVKTGAFTATGDTLRYLESFEQWYRTRVVKVLASEKSVIGAIGYAGRLDLHAILRADDGTEYEAVIDFKSQRQRNRQKASFYIEWAMQLSAYAAALAEENGTMPALVSLVIPSDAPGPLETKRWDNAEEALRAFHACHTLWSFEKGYRP